MTIIDVVRQAMEAQKLIESSIANTTFMQVQEFARQVEESQNLVANTMEQMAAPYIAAETFASDFQQRRDEMIAAIETTHARPTPFLGLEPTPARAFQAFDSYREVEPRAVDDTPDYSSTSRPALKREIGFLYPHDDEE